VILTAEAMLNLRHPPVKPEFSFNLTHLTPSIPLSFKGEGEEKEKRGLRPS